VVGGDNMGGYESRLYLVNKSDARDDSGKCWAQIIARFDLSVAHDYVVDEIKRCSDTDCYFYGQSGKVLTDEYGKALKEIPVGKMIEILSYAVANLDYYHKYKPVLAFLLSINPIECEWNNLVVLHYGY
jgi:hypothetical protein